MENVVDLFSGLDLRIEVDQTLPFFYAKHLYKNAEAEICPKI